MKKINFYTIAILLIAALALMGCNNKEEGKSSSQGSIAVISDSTMIDDDGDLIDTWDGTWITLEGQPAAIYPISDEDEDDK